MVGSIAGDQEVNTERQKKVWFANKMPVLIVIAEWSLDTFSAKEIEWQMKSH